MTNDSSLFRIESGPGRLPLYEGKMIHQFTHQWSKPRYWIDPTGRNELVRQELRRLEMALDALAVSQGYGSTVSSRQERVTAFLEKLGYPPLTTNDLYIAADVYRLAFRDIAASTNERTLITAVLPVNVFAGNTLNYLVPWHFNVTNVLAQLPAIKDCYEYAQPLETVAYLCGVLNSFTLDYLVRFKVTTHVNMFYFYQLPVPRLSVNDAYGKAIATRAARLICVGPEFDKLRDELLGDVNAYVAIDAAERKQLQCEIDGLVAQLYSLTEKEFHHILKSFPRLSQSDKDLLLDSYNTFDLEPDKLHLAELISKGENDMVEFKVAACCNPFTKAKDNFMKDKVVQAVAAFLNKEGGKVLIGVDNNGKVVGLEDDYKVAHAQQSRQNSDGYQLFLSDTLSADLGKELTAFYEISIHSLEGKDICCIDVQPSDEPVYVRNSKFYVRHGNGKLDMNMKEAMAYIKRHWVR